MGAQKLIKCKLEDRPRIVNILGKTFNRLKAVEFLGVRPVTYSAVWRFECLCGCGSKDVIATGIQVRHGRKTVCTRSVSRSESACKQWAPRAARYLKDAAAGMTGREIAKKWGVWPSAVNACLARHCTELIALKAKKAGGQKP